MIKRSLGLALIKRPLGRLLLKMAWGAPRARTLNFCPKRLTAILFPVKLARSKKARAREVGARMMTKRKFLSPPLLALAPQSDHGSAARAETEAFFQYGPPSYAGSP